MADNVDTLDFFGRLENRLALVATMTGAQGHRLVNLAEASADPVAGNLANELEALRVDVAAVVDEVRKLARHAAAVEWITIPAAALAQQMQADAQTRANVVADRRTWPANVVASGASTTDNTPSGQLMRRLLELRGQGRLVDAAELMGSGLMLQAELQAQALANLANAPALADQATLDEVAARAQSIFHQLRQLVDTDARRRQLPAFDPTGPAWPDQRPAQRSDADAAEAQQAEIMRQLMELRRQGRLLDARALVDPGLATYGLLDLVEQLANGLADSPVAGQLADVIRRQIRTLADTDARAAQTPVYMVLGPAYPQSDKALEGIGADEH